MNAHTPNLRLRALLAESGWTNRALASAVNRIGAELGRELKYDHSAVSHWLAGTPPRAPAPALIVEAFSRRLGRTVTAAEAGLLASPAVRATVSSAWDRETLGDSKGGAMVLALLAFSDADPTRRAAMQELLYSAGDALGVRPWADTGPMLADVAAADKLSGWGRVGEAEVKALEDVTIVFSAALSSFGGGQVRASLAAFLASSVSTWLKAPAAPRTHSALLSAAARLTYVAATSAADSGAHGLAQRYHRTALSLAREADDPAMFAITVRAMSSHAQFLGHHRLARYLAEAAVNVRPDPRRHNLSGSVRAFTSAQLAVAEALEGDPRAASKSLQRAERYFAMPANGSSAGFMSYPATALHYQHGMVADALGDFPAASAAFSRSLLERPRTHHLMHALTVARLARVHMGANDVEQACVFWQRFLAHYPHVNSVRASQQLRMMYTGLRPYRNQPAVRELLERRPR